jgi:hypothetical protein
VALLGLLLRLFLLRRLDGQAAGGAYYADWLEGELLTAARTGELTPKSLGQLTNRWFAAQPDVDAWLRRVWPMWFSRPYPG